MNHQRTEQEANRGSERAMERIILQSDNGTRLEFTGRVFSETSFYDEESGSLTRMRLFLTDQGSQVYSIVIADGGRKQRRHYSVKPEGELCMMSDGEQTLAVPTEMLFAAVFGLCGLDPARADDLRTTFSETLRLAIG